MSLGKRKEEGKEKAHLSLSTFSVLRFNSSTLVSSRTPSQVVPGSPHSLGSALEGEEHLLHPEGRGQEEGGRQEQGLGDQEDQADGKLFLLSLPFLPPRLLDLLELPELIPIPFALPFPCTFQIQISMARIKHVLNERQIVYRAAATKSKAIAFEQKKLEADRLMIEDLEEQVEREEDLLDEEAEEDEKEEDEERRTNKA